ncbi:hypothetical protein COT57_02320 [Candidatus Micrarchaeota archaeon CG09_land_8_20_14_0_10_55_25]|nr:MAG: hypothetical protein COT57_02320 [Candidatus Micrarchaeota archaeon CG09_land_8_20_14_0_10_55_25]
MRKLLFFALLAPLFLAAAYTCQNVDGGRNPGVYGDCNDVNGPHQEYCLDSKTLVEYYCPTEGAWGVVCQKEEIVCSGACVNGACGQEAESAIQPTKNPALPESTQQIDRAPTTPLPVRGEEKPAFPVDTEYIKFVLFGLIVFVAIAYLASTWLNTQGKTKGKARRPNKRKKRK